jgi:hypothetical protein
VQLEALARQVPPEILVLLVHKEQQDPPDLKEIPDRQALRVLLETPDPREQLALKATQAQPVPLVRPGILVLLEQRAILARQDLRAPQEIRVLRAIQDPQDHRAKLAPPDLRETLVQLD